MPINVFPDTMQSNTLPIVTCHPMRSFDVPPVALAAALPPRLTLSLTMLPLRLVGPDRAQARGAGR